MHNVRLLILFMGWSSALFFVIGLYKPWAMLWWEDVQNRKKIFQVYGTLTTIFFAIYFVLKFF